jgi:hypothetical protein
MKRREFFGLLFHFTIYALALYFGENYFYAALFYYFCWILVKLARDLFKGKIIKIFFNSIILFSVFLFGSVVTSLLFPLANGEELVMGGIILSSILIYLESIKS